MAHNSQRIIDHVRLVRRLCRKAADLLRRKRQLERGLDRLILPAPGICVHCGMAGAHYVPPMFGEDGFFCCMAEHRGATVGFDIEARPLRLGPGAKAGAFALAYGGDRHARPLHPHQQAALDALRALPPGKPLTFAFDR